MPVRGAIAIVVLVAALVAGCGGGSTSTGEAGDRAAELLAGPIGSYLGPGNHPVGGVTAVEIRLDRKARCEAPKPPPCRGDP